MPSRSADPHSYETQTVLLGARRTEDVGHGVVAFVARVLEHRFLRAYIHVRLSCLA